MFFIHDPVHRENGLIEFRQPRHIFGAQIHMVVVEFHSVKALLDNGMTLSQ
jgi:hypothetical protein